MRRHTPIVLAVLLAALGALSVASAPAPTAVEAVVATDPCGPGPDPAEVVADAQDLCSVTARLTLGAGAPVLELAVTLVDATTLNGVYVTGVEVADCTALFRFEDDVTDPTTLVVHPPTFGFGCGAFEDTCILTFAAPPVGSVGQDCRRVFEDGQAEVRVDEPVVDGDTLTFRVVLDDELAPLAARLTPGTVVQHHLTTSSLDVPFATRGAGLIFTVCTDEPDDCSTLLSDATRARDASLTVPEHD